MVEFIVFFKVVSLIVTILIIWFNSGAFAAYCKVLGLTNLLLGYNKNTDNLTFPQYLYIKRKFFFKSPACIFLIELLTCPLCLTLWLSIFGAGMFLNILYIPTIFLISLLVYSLFTRIID